MAEQQRKINDKDIEKTEFLIRMLHGMEWRVCDSYRLQVWAIIFLDTILLCLIFRLLGVDCLAIKCLAVVSHQI